jgi:hypothetical protein
MWHNTGSGLYGRDCELGQAPGVPHVAGPKQQKEMVLDYKHRTSFFAGMASLSAGHCCIPVVPPVTNRRPGRQGTGDL